ncbi:MAG: MCP four helix bundle domain-containing protein [Candidatus Kapabacteria bacterium]|jgi:methyl-accepting chemotaxis protein|nr:MCP four helix bundle domain-containing protein [Candidatus Kapabacteria bacterium]
MTWFYNLRISTKLRLTFGALVMLIISAGYSGYDGMMRIIPNFDSMYKDRLVPAIQFFRMLKDVNTVRSLAIRHINTNEAAEMQALEEKITATNNDFDSILEAYAATYLVEAEKRNLAQLRTDLQEFRVVLKQELALSKELRREEALQLHLGAFAKATDNIAATMSALIDVQDMVGKELFADSETIVIRQRGVIVGAIVGGLLVALLLGWVIIRAIGRPMRDLQNAAAEIANGNTNISIQAEYNDEVGSLGRTFLAMAKNLEKLLHDVRTKSAEAQNAASEANSARQEALEQQEFLRRKVDEILVQMENLAAGDVTVSLRTTGETVANAAIMRLFQGFNATVESIRNLVTQLNSATQQTGMVSVSMSSLAEEISAIVEQQSAQTTFISNSTSKMANSLRTNAENAASVQGATEELSRHVQELATAGTKINAISRSIGDIAFQINLLSLNASIEAARAGRAGKGFAVVAAEVKSLAQSTARSTDEIKSIVAEVQHRIHEISAMTTTQASRNGVLHSSQRTTAQKSVVEMVAEIAATIDEQSSASSEIAENTHQISLSAQQTATSVMHITRTAEELTQLTEKLQNLVGKFVLNGTAEYETASVLQRPSGRYLEQH